MLYIISSTSFPVDHLVRLYSRVLIIILYVLAYGMKCCEIGMRDTYRLTRSHCILVVVIAVRERHITFFIENPVRFFTTHLVKWELLQYIYQQIMIINTILLYFDVINFDSKSISSISLQHCKLLILQDTYYTSIQDKSMAITWYDF